MIRRTATLRRKPETGINPVRRAARRGAAVVELAICLPVLLTVALGMIEVCNFVFVQVRMQSAAYEAVRLATRPTTSTATAATAAQVTSYCSTLLTQLGVQGASITLTPSDLSTLAPQSQVSVSITAPTKSNCPTSFVLSSATTLTAQATMVFE